MSLAQLVATTRTSWTAAAAPARRRQQPTAIAAAAPAVLSAHINLNMQRQLHSEWCWAAVSSSLSHHFGGAATQCAIVNAEMGQSTCCVNGGGANCNRPWFLERALMRVGHLRNFGAQRTAMGFLSSEIGAGRPVCTRIGWFGGGGHFVAISGVAGMTLTIRDPLFGTSSYNAHAFATAYRGAGQWTHTYFTR